MAKEDPTWRFVLPAVVFVAPDSPFRYALVEGAGLIVGGLLIPFHTAIAMLEGDASVSPRAKVIVLTALTEEAYRLAAYNNGAEDFLDKRDIATNSARERQGSPRYLGWWPSCRAGGRDGGAVAVQQARDAFELRVAMEVTGHKTRSVFDRYHIVSPADLRDVARRLAAACTFGHVST